VRAGPLDDFERDAGGGLHELAQRIPAVAGIGPHQFQRGEHRGQAAGQQFRAGLVADRGGHHHEGEQPALAVDDEVPAAALDLLPAVVAAGRGGNGVRALHDLRIDDARGRLLLPALPLAQPFPQPGDYLLRQASLVPPLVEGVNRIPGREIDGNGAPFDPVPDHIGDRVAHRPQVVVHRASLHANKIPHYLPGLWLQYSPFIVRQVRRVARRPVMAQAAF